MTSRRRIEKQQQDRLAKSLRYASEMLEDVAEKAEDGDEVSNELEKFDREMERIYRRAGLLQD